VQDLADGAELDFGHWRLRAGEVEHGQALLGIAAWWHCLGYRIEADGKALVVSGDATYSPGLVALARGADVLVQACSRAESELAGERDRAAAEQFFASAGVAGRIASEAGVATLILTHLGSKARVEEMEADVRQSFDGLLVIGEDLLGLDV
jgi:ribonuclease Z